MNFRYLYSFAALLLLAVSCRKDNERDPCLQPRDAPLRIQTRQRRDTTLVDTALPTARLTPIGGLTALQYRSPTTVLQLTLAPDRDSCRWAIQPDSNVAVADTVTLRYTRRLQFLSNACGYTYFFTLQSASVTGNAVDSVRVNNSDISNDANSPVHILLYYRRR